MRIEVERTLLEKTSNSVPSVAVQCGFPDMENMRRTYLSDARIGPTEYREQFTASTEFP